MVDLVAKNSGTKISAQWSNEEVVRQILLELVEQDGDKVELLKKVMDIQ